MEESVFAKIIKGEFPSYMLYEDDVCVAFLTIMPHSKGHLLIVPREQVDYIFDLDDDTYHHLFVVAKKLSGPLQSVTGARKVGLAVEGLAVPHVHVHLIPVFKENDLDSVHAYKASTEELEEMQEKITAAINNT